MLQRWYILGGLKAGVIMIAVGIYCALTLLGACPEFSLLLRQSCVALLQPASTPRVCVCCSNVSDSVTPWTVAHQAPLSMGFSRQEHWSGLPCPPPGDLPTQRWNPGLLHCRRVLFRLSHQGSLPCQSVAPLFWPLRSV